MATRSSRMNTTGAHSPVATGLLLWVLMNAIAATGCSVIGYTVGSAFDSAVDWDSVGTLRIPPLEEGDEICATLHDGRIVEGQFMRYDTLAIDEYLPIYRERVNDLRKEVLLPLPGDSIVVVPNSQDRQVNFIFLGFSGEGILVTGPSQATPGFVRLKWVYQIGQKGGEPLKSDQVNMLMERGEIVTRTGTWIEIENRPERFSHDRIRSIITRKQSNARYVMGGIGLAIDMILIIGVATAPPLHLFPSN